MSKLQKHHDHWRRSFIKTVTYRLIIIVVLFIVTSLITGNLKQALQITGWNTVLATAIYYFHERAWSRIKWGRS